MIYVKEINPPIKMSGLSSFIITPEAYSKEVYDIISRLTINRYDPKNTKKEPYYYLERDGFWEISCVDIKSFLEQATKLDDIHLELVETNEDKQLKKELSQEEIESFKLKPFKHQIEAINFTLTKKGKWLLLDSMGLGKTGTIIYTAEILKRRGLIDHCLIICCVNAIKENWANEIKKFSNETYTILGKKIGKRGGISYASIPERAKILKNPIEEFFIITNIETIASDVIVEAFKKSKNNFGMIAVDEIHMANNKNSIRGHNLLKLEADYKIAATGTLITNSPISAYLPLAWTENDKSTLTTYRPQYEVKGEITGQVVGYKNLEVLQEEIATCSMRRTLDQVRDDMPPKIVSYDYIDLDKSHLEFYNNIKNGIIDERAKVDLTNGNLLALTTRLRQASVDPMILTDTEQKSTKLERCVELVDELVSQGEKVLILSNFVPPLKRLEKMLAKYNPLMCIGELKDDVVMHNNLLFQEDPNYKVALGTHKRVGTGLTFNSAAYLIMLDTPWTYSSFAQSSDRIYRVNNTRPAYIKVLVNNNTIDERVLELIETKKDLGDILVDGKKINITPAMAKEMRKIIMEL